MSAQQQQYWKPFDLFQRLEQSEESDVRGVVKEFIMRILLHHGMMIFGSTARDMIRDHFKYAMKGIHAAVEYYGDSDVDAFFLDDSPERRKLSPEARFDMNKEKRWNLLVQHLKYYEIDLKQVESREEPEYSMDIRVFRHVAFISHFHVEIGLDVVAYDLTVVKTQFDADVNAFAITKIRKTDEVEWIFLGQNEKSARKNLNKGMFEFLLDESNTKIAGVETLEKMSKKSRKFYKSVLRSNRWCKLRNADYKTKAGTVPIHGQWAEGFDCFLCGRDMDNFLWSCFCCDARMHHACFLRFMRRSCSYVKNKKNLDQIVNCPACKESPL